LVWFKVTVLFTADGGQPADPLNVSIVWRVLHGFVAVTYPEPVDISIACKPLYTVGLVAKPPAVHVCAGLNATPPLVFAGAASVANGLEFTVRLNGEIVPLASSPLGMSIRRLPFAYVVP
jgi:hypothetical protein